MVEVGECPADPGRHLTHLRDHARRQVSEADEGAAGQVAQQSHVRGAAEQVVDGGRDLTVEVGKRHRDAQCRLRVGDQCGRRILGGQLERREGGVGDLQHPGGLLTGTEHQEVLVLVAAKRFRPRAQPVVRRQ